jgi:hypothetical protein
MIYGYETWSMSGKDDFILTHGSGKIYEGGFGGIRTKQGPKGLI